MSIKEIPDLSEPILVDDLPLCYEVSEAASHWDRLNDAKWWDKRRFHSGKYEIVACVGDPYDYTYETVDSTNRWKEARRFEQDGCDVYVNGKHVHFVDHDAVQKAFGVIKGITLCRHEPFWDDGFMDPEDVADIEEAHKVLDKNGFKVTDAIAEKWMKRGEYVNDPLNLPRESRPRYLFRGIETDELPF